MTKRMPFVLSEWGYWGEELIGPLEACDAAGYEVAFLTPAGRKILRDSVGPDGEFIGNVGRRPRSSSIGPS